VRRRVLPLIAVALLVASACGSGTSPENAQPARVEEASDSLAKTQTVHLPKSYRFEPESVEVARGGVVTWINEDDFPHTVQLLEGDEPDRPLAVGGTTSVTFGEAGVFEYNCSLHPTQMSGTVTVSESSS
jgi:plastocyanin